MAESCPECASGQLFWVKNSFFGAASFILILHKPYKQVTKTWYFGIEIHGKKISVKTKNKEKKAKTLI